MTMNHWLNRWLVPRKQSPRYRILGVLLGSLLALAAQAAPVTLNLKDAEITALVESMSVLTGKNFIVDPRV
jgi:general secretion pathway protein D